MTKQHLSIPLSIPEITGVNRTSEVVVGGVPIARGALREAGWFELQSEAGDKFPLESTPAAYWPDGSIKWLHLCGAVDLSSGKENNFQLVLADNTAKNDRLKVEQNIGEVSIGNGEYEIRLSSAATNALEVKHKGKSLLAAPGITAAMFLCGPDGENRREYSLSFKDETSVVVQTDNRVVVRLPGIVGEADNPVGEIILFVEVLKGVPQLRLQPVFIYLGHPDKDLVASLTMTVHTQRGGDEAHYGFANEQGKGYWDVLQPYEGGPEWTQARQVQLGSSFYQTEKRVSSHSPWVKISEGKHSQGWCHLGGKSGGVTAAMRYFWQEYPRSLMVDTQQSTLTFGLVPPDTSPLDLRRYSPTIYGKPVYEYSSGEFPTETHGAGGIAKASELMLHFHPDESQYDQETPARQSLSFNHPCRLMTDPEYFAATQVIGRVAPRREDAFANVEQELAHITDFMVQEREYRGWYGLMNYGDVMMAFYTERDRWGYDDGGYAWINVESLPDLGLWVQALRCGRSDWLKAAIEMSRHNRDVDIYHRGEFQGFGTRHNVNHWGCKDKEWRVSMPLVRRLHYYLTADPWTLEVIKATVARYQGYERTAGIVSMASVLAGIMVKCELQNREEDWQTLKNFADVFTRAVRDDGQITAKLHVDLSTGKGEPDAEAESNETMAPRFNRFGGQHTLCEIAELLDDTPLKDALVRHVDFVIGATREEEELPEHQKLRSSVSAHHYAPPTADEETVYRQKLLFAVQPFLTLAYCHTGKARYLNALKLVPTLARIVLSETGGEGLLEDPPHRFLPDLQRRNKAMCHLGDMLHLMPYGLAGLDFGDESVA